MSDRADWELVAQAQSGDLDAFAELVQRYEGPVTHFCRRMVASQEDAEDLAQESFVRVYRYLGRLRPDARFSTVLFGVARNLTLNFLRDTRRRGRGLTRSLTRQDESDGTVADLGLPPDRAAGLREIQDWVERGLERLSPDHREILLLREVQGMDYDAIAEVLKCRKGTVKSRLARARDQLRARIVELGGEP